jgi:alcohol sulfotransferase
MKKLEEENLFGNKRLVPGDKGTPNSYKVRRGKVGGYRDYFNERELTTIDELVRSGLSPYYMAMEERARLLRMSPV